MTTRRALGMAGFVLLALVAVAVAYGATADSMPLATAAVLAVSTAAAMHVRLAAGRWWAAAQVAACALLLAGFEAAPRLVGGVLISGLAGAELVGRTTLRSAVLRAGAWTGIIAGLASLSGLASTVPLPLLMALREAAGAVAGGILGAPLMLTFGPMAESLFGHTTRLTMGEWLNYEQPLLRDLAAAAPGTFQHSVNVGVLANAAADAIGADPLRARVGGLYHDVGKLRAPEYFIENQHDTNPHDELEPEASADVLRAHVSDGVELVTEHRMREQIADFVREHHGTGEMRSFRQKAIDLGRTPAEDDFRYAGPRPRSRETGILMIADQLEATARARPPADEAASEAMVRETVERIRAEGQLLDSGLTGSDFSKLQPALVRTLMAMYHRRLTYPPAGPAAPPRRRLALAGAFGRRRGGS